ncbi:Hypoxia up-regulated protein 1 [Cladobotryum mycophilum]|uniref:Hypoxia up-regulated protein 1 n=1 Tax=Cladobotryum mycophilum TaxID=491253 RepID=A0ABR0SZE8_9HYPO
MAAPAAQTVSKSSKKKAAKALERTESPAPSTGSGPADKAADNDEFESPYIKELQKNIRNTNKKLTNASKTDAILSQHSEKSLDELVAEKIINADQKAQILKKPALQAQIAQFEEQLVQYQKVHEQYQARATAEKAEWEKSVEKAKADAVGEAKAEFKSSLDDHLLVLSQFLRLAAYRREEAKDPESDESQAIEGVLLAIYAGDETAVSSMLKLIEGSEDQIISVPGEQLQTTYATVKSIAKTYQAPSLVEGTQAPETQETTEVASDPTIANEAATEIEAGDGALTNGESPAEPATNGLANAEVADDAANAVAENQWDSANKEETSISQEWVDVAAPKETAETETVPETTPAAAAAAEEVSRQSWADDHPETTDAAPASADPNDGFHQVQRNRGRQDREGGGGRGRGRGEWRGRGGGHRGDGRGRGRGSREISFWLPYYNLALLRARALACIQNPHHHRSARPPKKHGIAAVFPGVDAAPRSHLLFSTNVLAAAAVLGVDLGTEYIKAALVKPGIPLEIVLTKDSRRKETSAVAFQPIRGARKEGQFPERNYGADAMAIAARFPAEVYPNLKTVLGLPVGDSIVQEYAARHPALKLETHSKRGTAAFKSNSLEAGEEAWMVEELLAMEFQSIQKNAEATAGGDSTVRSIVLTVPTFYTIEEKRAVQMAAELAGFKVLSLISDGLAVGLNYATSRQFPNINEGAKPEYHLVYDMGAGSTTAAIMRFQSRSVKDIGKFNKTVQEIQVLGSGWDRTLGGDSLNYLIVDDMISQFLESKGAQKISATAEGVKAHGRAIAKLSKEAERLRHVLSANQNTQASFEGLYEDVDFKYKITRTEFEAMAEGHAERVSIAINDALKMSNLDIGDLTSVILHGGATRTPFVQKALEKIIGSSDKIRTNVNSDEAAVFGAAFRAAELSPSFRVKEIRISEGSMYPAGLTWTTSSGKTQRQRLWTAVSPQGAAPKEMTFTELDDFSGTFYQQIGEENKEVRSFSTKNLTATVAALKEKYPSCVDTQFKVGFKLRTENGEVEIVKAAVECEAEVSESFVDGVKNLFGFGKKDQQPLKDGEEAKAESEGSEEVKSDAKSSTSKSSESSTSSGAKTKSTEEAKNEVKTKQIVSIPVEVAVEKTGIPQLTKTEWTKAKDRLKAFATSDKARQQREEALNQLEGYTYKIRDLVDAENFIAKSTEEEREVLTQKASETSDWLYEEGEEATKEDFKAKLKVLQDLVAPIQKRVDEAAKRPQLIGTLKDSLNQTTVFLNGLRQQVAEYEEWKAKASDSATPETKSDFDGLEDDDSASAEGSTEEMKEKETGPLPPLYKPEELDELEALQKSTLEWLNEMLAKQEGVAENANPILLSSDLIAKQEKLNKASIDLALKGVKQMKKPKKPSSKDKKKPTKAKSAGGQSPPLRFPRAGCRSRRMRWRR